MCFVIGLLGVPAAAASPAPSSFKAFVNRAHPCLALIFDREDRSWDPTVSFGGGHDVNASYGLGQANPGTKMARFGKAWRTSVWVQLRWAIAYAQKYGGECGAWAFWRAHSWW